MTMVVEVAQVSSRRRVLSFELRAAKMRLCKPPRKRPLSLHAFSIWRGTTFSDEQNSFAPLEARSRQESRCLATS
jgi:hypothetical protein